MQQHTIQIFMWAWYPESAKIHQKVSGGFWPIQDMSNIYTGGFWWIQNTSILCVTKLVDFGGFRILSSKNTQGVRVKPQLARSWMALKPLFLETIPWLLCKCTIRLTQHWHTLRRKYISKAWRHVPMASRQGRFSSIVVFLLFDGATIIKRFSDSLALIVLYM